MRLGTRSLIALAAALAGLLTTLAVLQYRWIAEISRAEEARIRGSIAESSNRLADDVDREVTRAFLMFRPSANMPQMGGAESIEAHWRRWWSSAPRREIVRDIYRWSPNGDAGGGTLERFDSRSRELTPVPWPAELEPVRSRITNGLFPGVMRDGPLVPEVPALLVPGERVERGPFGAGSGSSPLSITIVVFDSAWMAGTFLPELVSRHFGQRIGEIQLAVTTIPRKTVVFATDGSARPILHSDITRDFFSIREFPEFRDPEIGDARPFRGQRGRPRGGPPVAAPRHEGPPPPLRTDSPPPGGGPQPPPAEQPLRSNTAWRLDVFHSGGTLSEAVAATRWRNLAVSLGILALLGASIAVMMIALRRENRLAQQQMEFVAGVTHELNTPLAGIRAAGQNLADGIVRDDEQVRKYGAMIATDGRRLADLVDDVLAFAGLSSSRHESPTSPIDLQSVLEDAIRDQTAAAGQSATLVEASVPERLPMVKGNADELRRAFGNLIGNAIKYGGDRPPIEVRAESDGRQIRVTVRDHGPGIPKPEIPRIFEPFWRGAHATSRQFRGSGLGLSIVKRILDAHGARIAVHSSPGRGTEVVVTMRAMEDDR